MQPKDSFLFLGPFRLCAIPLAIAVVAFLLQLLSRFHRRSRFKRQHGCEDPQAANKDPFFGLDIILSNLQNTKSHTLLPELVSRYRKFGSTYSIKYGLKNVLSTMEPENLKSILSTNFASYDLGPIRTAGLKNALGESIFSSSGAEWKHSRAMIRPNLVKERFVSQEMSTFEKHFSHFLAKIPRDGTEVDLQPMFFTFTLNAALEIICGHETQELSSDLPESEDIENIFNNVMKGSHQAMVGFLPFSSSKSDYIKYTSMSQNWTDRYVVQAMEEHRARELDTESKTKIDKDKPSLLAELVKDSDSVLRIRSEILAVLIAGRDTTASALSSLWFVLAKRPDIVEKLQVEVASLGGEKPDFETLKKMQYLQNTIHEVLRLYPSIPVNFRQATVDTMLPIGGGLNGKSPIFVPAGTSIIFNVYAMHRRQDLFGQDAEEFRPERWENKSLRPGWGYLPFSGGPRLCIGQQFALTEVAYMTVRMLQEFVTVTSCDDSPWQENWTISCSVKSGCKVSLLPYAVSNEAVTATKQRIVRLEERSI